MKCREFKNVAEAMSLRDIASLREHLVSAHAEECPKCGAWLQERRTIAAALYGLSEQTAERGASQHVEQALLRAFRQRNREASPQSAGLGFHGFAVSLSRWFELGAYAAVAAALLVALLLGYRVWQHPEQLPIRAQSTPAATSPSEVKAANSSSQPESKVAARRQTASARKPLASRASRVQGSTADASSDDTLASADYANLMFCDPLSCSGDTQVVRMEVPAQGAQNGQTVTADVVLGEDGLVRAVRIVN